MLVESPDRSLINDLARPGALRKIEIFEKTEGLSAVRRVFRQQPPIYEIPDFPACPPVNALGNRGIQLGAGRKRFPRWPADGHRGHAAEDIGSFLDLPDLAGRLVDLGGYADFHVLGHGAMVASRPETPIKRGGLALNVSHLETPSATGLATAASSAWPRLAIIAI